MHPGDVPFGYLSRRVSSLATSIRGRVARRRNRIEKQVSHTGLRWVSVLGHDPSGCWLLSRTVAPSGYHSRAPNLSVLHVANTAFDDAGAKALVSAAPNLGALFVDSTKLTDAGLKELEKLTKLRTLYNYTNEVTRKGVEEFKKANPKCLVPFPGK